MRDAPSYRLVWLTLPYLGLWPSRQRCEPFRAMLGLERLLGKSNWGKKAPGRA